MFAISAVVVLSGIVPADVTASVDASRGSICVVRRADQRIELRLRETDWQGRDDLCQSLVRLARPERLPRAGEWPSEDGEPEEKGGLKTFADRLAASGYFSRIGCREPNEKELVCDLWSQRVVREVTVRGPIPFPFLASEVKRRLFVRPGSMLSDDLVHRRATRLADFFARQGIFGVSVETAIRDREGHGPLREVELLVTLSEGRRYALGAVVMEGDRVLDKRTVERHMRHYWIPWLLEERFSPERMHEDTAELEETLRRRDWPEARVKASFSLDDVHDIANVVVHIRSGPRLSVRFVGNRAIDAEDLAELATFAQAGAIDDVEAQHTSGAIRSLYQQKGYYRASVSAELESSGDRHRTVTFVIDEGPRAEIERVDIRGGSLPSDREVKLITAPSGICTTGRWVDAWIDRDANELERHFRSRGFADVAVVAEREIGEDGSLALVWSIREGERQWVSSVDVRGWPEPLGTQGVTPRLLLREGEPFVAELLDEDKHSMQMLLAAHGYLNANVNQRLRRSTGVEGGIHIEHQVLPGTRSRLGGELVLGDFRTRPAFVRAQLGLEDGDPLDIETVSRGRRRLLDLGIFNAVSIEPIPVAGEDEETWLRISLEERDVQSLDLALAFSTDDKFSTGIDYSDRNLFGHGVTIDLTTRVGNAAELLSEHLRIGNRDRAAGRLRAPHPLGVPLDLDIHALAEREDQRLFSEEAVQVGLAASREVLSRLRCDGCPSVSLVLGYEASASRLQSKVADSSASDSRESVYRIVPSLTLDSTDSLFSPRRGIRATLRFELAHPLLGLRVQASTFWRLVITASAYLPLLTPFRWESDDTVVGGPIVAMIGMRYGAAQPFANDQRLPGSEAFYYGGDLSLRGSEPRASGLAVREGRYLLLGSAELRWQILPELWLGSVEIGAFVDFGTVSHSLADLWADVAITSGPILRYVTLVGPLSLSYAWPISRPAGIVAADPAAMPSRGRLHITFGAAF